MHKSEFLQQNLLLIREIILNGYFLVSLDFLSIFLVFCGIIVIISKNPVISIIFLIDLFSGIASYLITLGLTFIDLYYDISYVGTVLILSLFILMLIDVIISKLENFSNSSIFFSLRSERGRIILSSLCSFSFEERKCKQINIVPSPPPWHPPPYLSFPLSEYLSFPFPLSRKGERDRQRKGEKRYPGMGTPLGGDPPWGPIGDPPPGRGLVGKNHMLMLFFFFRGPSSNDKFLSS